MNIENPLSRSVQQKAHNFITATSRSTTNQSQSREKPHKHIAKPAESISTPPVSYLQSSITLEQGGCELSRSRRRRTDHLITSCSVLHPGSNEPAYPENFVLALTSQPT